MKNLLKSLNVVASVLVAMFVSAFLSTMTGIRVGFFVAGFLLLGTVGRSQAGVLCINVSPNVEGIANYLGLVRPTLFGTLYNNFDIANDITLVPNVKSTMRLTKLLINNGAEPYSGIYEPNNDDIAYSEQDLVVSQWQRDMLLDPRKYVNTYLESFRAAGEGALNNTIPFAQYTVSQFLRQIAASMNNTSAFFGLGTAAFAAYNAGTVYNAGAAIKYVPNGNTKLQYYICNATTTAGQSPDTTPAKWTKRNDLALCVGLGTRIKTDRTNGIITNVVSTGAITDSSDAYDQCKAVYRSLPDPVKAQGVMLYMARGVYELLIDDIQNQVGKYTETDESGIVYLYNTERKCMLKPTTWQYGSQLIIATPKENLLMGTDLQSDMNEINIIPDVYNIKWGMTGVIGFNYQDAAVMAINDQN
jgi:hypothetical protein